LAPGWPVTWKDADDGAVRVDGPDRLCRLGERWVLASAEKAIGRLAQSGLSAGPEGGGLFRYDTAWPPHAERLLPFMHGLVGPSRWSVSDLSRPIELPLRRGGQEGP